MVEHMVVLPRNMGIVPGSDQHVIFFCLGSKLTPRKTEDSNIGMFEHIEMLECQFYP